MERTRGIIELLQRFEVIYNSLDIKNSFVV
jgi:hypothetical protein